MYWLLVMMAVNINNPKDIVGKVDIKFDSEQACRAALNTIEYEFKFKNFKIDAKCISNENNTNNNR